MSKKKKTFARDNGDPAKCVKVNITLPRGLVDVIEERRGNIDRSPFIRAILCKYLELPDFNRVYAGGRGKTD